ncbi:phosphotransferase enzyme family-domain-containing protein [Xylaria intraflava]|nr:phosphotransferase enzyme family-domain-containing protein [Xylaria intraflava]
MASPSTVPENGDGLAWVKHSLSLSPKWAIEPTSEAIVATLKASLDCDQEYNVTFLHDGAYSKLYEVDIGEQAFVMRVTLPVCSQSLTESEVATLGWVGQNTSLPVPRVKAYDSSPNNPLGFEWILMTKLPGKPLSERWSSMSMVSKERLVKQIAAFSTATFRQQFDGGIGSIYKAASDPRGPFFAASEWVRSRLQIASSDLTRRLENDITNDGMKTLQRMLELTKQIEILMPKFLSPSKKSFVVAPTNPSLTIIDDARDMPLRTVVYHDNLSFDNILVDDDGVFCGVIDWKCIPCVPLHESCQFPLFLQQAYDRFEEPIQMHYHIGQHEPPHPAYFHDLQRYEMSQLRLLYIEEMLDSAPDFVEIWRNGASADLRDYEAAVQNCDNESTIDFVSAWVKSQDVEKPSQIPKRLHEQLAV